MKQHQIDVDNISIDVKRATNYLDDEDEIRNAKMMVRDIMKPQKNNKKVDSKMKTFGMTPH